MAHTVIGTAGHIDHGKTQLVHALTGVDTDRTRQEKERGITIELGFAHFGQTTTIIDVPGHERFVKTMVAGVSTIDVALLVIAADDGVMPQTREHLDVLQILGIERGVIALNKVDLVDDEWLQLVEEDVRGVLQGTQLENSPILRVSALHGTGVDMLAQSLRETLAAVQERDARSRPFRLPVDRAFSIHGFGNVATGTTLSGQARRGDELEQLPQGRRLRIRGLQRHGEDVDLVEAGDRAAINLAGEDAEQIERGDVLIQPGSLQATSMLDVDLRLLESAPKHLEQRTRVRIHIGTTEALGRVVLLRDTTLEPGQQAMAQIRLEKPVVAAFGDRFVVRRYSPAVTIGGGTVLDPSPDKHREGEGSVALLLDELTGESMTTAVIAWVRHRGRRAPSLQDTGAAFASDGDSLEADAASSLTAFDHHGVRHLVTTELWEADQSLIVDTLTRYHRATPQEAGMARVSLMRELGFGPSEPLFEALLGRLEADGITAREGAAVRLSTHEISLSSEDEVLAERIEQELQKGGLAKPPSTEDLASSTGAEVGQVSSLLRAMGRLGRLVFLDETLFVSVSQMAYAREGLEKHLATADQISVSDFRQSLDTNRRYALALLNLFDAEGLTVKDDAGRRSLAPRMSLPLSRDKTP
ncbi:MAG: selenocysteine-specific translation elongation factor [Candidatus Latescibacterota bacterium]|nr:selenocysteine-specific translation elongation factor [Candidatus Latescibacterota bacterium]